MIALARQRHKAGRAVAPAMRLVSRPGSRWVRLGAVVSIVMLIASGCSRSRALGYATYFSHVQADLAEAHVVGGALLMVALVRLRLGASRKAISPPPPVLATSARPR